MKQYQGSKSNNGFPKFKRERSLRKAARREGKRQALGL